LSGVVERMPDPGAATETRRAPTLEKEEMLSKELD
jgi:hypothetical protein